MEKRFIAASDGPVSFYVIAQLIKKERPKKSGNISDLKSLTDDLYVRVSNQKAKEFFKRTPISKEEALLASLSSAEKTNIKIPKVLEGLLEAQA